MKYQDKSFSVGGHSKDYAENWDRTFKKERPMRPCKYCGRDCRRDYCSRACCEADDSE